MDNSFIAFDELKKLSPDEWILLGDFEMKNTSVLGSIDLYHYTTPK